MAGLLGAEDIARAANFQIAQGDAETRAEFGVFLDGLEPLCGDRRDRPIFRQEHIGIRAVLVPPDAAAKLVQFGKAEAVGVVDDDGIGVGDIEAGFDDGRADQHIDPALHEVDHRLFEFVFGHLAVADGDAGIRHDALHFVGHLVYGLHAVMEEKYLPLAVQFADDGLADQSLCRSGTRPS